MRFAEALAASDQLPGPARLWHGDAGEHLAQFAADLLDSADAGPPVAASRYPGLLDGLMAGQVVRPRFGGHPRLAIWGTIEARLQRADLMILGGINEGTWPAETDPGPWLSRPMRADFGLPPVEQRIGLMAHDFVQAFCAPEVVITRATRAEGTPTVPSRWLLRLDAVLGALGLDPLAAGDTAPVQWAQRLDQPAATRPLDPPAPTPPLHARPREVSVTRIEIWRRNPYGLYAQKILGLRALDPLDEDPGAAEKGLLIHKALEHFVTQYPDALPADPAAELMRIGQGVFDELDVRPGVRAFWWPRFARVAGYVATLERARRQVGDVRVLAECLGQHTLDAPGGPFTVTAKADRIEQHGDGHLAIVDYKTGAPPSETAVRLGDSPQLPLEAAIAAHGGFDGLPAGTVAELAYWKLSGGPTPGEERALTKTDPATLAADALDGLAKLVAHFDDPATPYRAYPDPARAPRYDDYAHLARVAEWRAGEPGS
jgi:ATP-dependent helicase/nuclease subunit B